MSHNSTEPAGPAASNGRRRPARARRRSGAKGRAAARGRAGRPRPRRCRRPALLAGSPDHFADPGAGLLIQRPGHVAFPGLTVRLDLLQDHPAQARRKRRRQQRATARISISQPCAHATDGGTGVTIASRRPRRGGAVWRGALPADRPGSRAGSVHTPGRMRPDAPRPVEWACKLAERPFTLCSPSSPHHTADRRETAPLRCALTQCSRTGVAGCPGSLSTSCPSPRFSTRRGRPSWVHSPGWASPLSALSARASALNSRSTAR